MSDASDPSYNAVPLVKADGAPIKPPRAIYVGTGGDITLRTTGSGTTNVVFKNVPSGYVLPVRPSMIMGATTAADIVGLY